MTGNRKGWYNESDRHALASRGVATSLNKWERAKNYRDEDLSDYYIGYARTRDSGMLENSNWDVFVKELGNMEGVRIDRFNHWAVGWVEQILIDEDSEEAVEKAEQLQGELERYPILDEDDYFRREYERTIENIEFEGDVSPDDAVEVYYWLSTHIPRAIESSADEGGYPSKEQIDEALENISRGR